MSITFKKVANYIFISFLLFYFCTIFIHTLELDKNFINIIIFLLGLLLAFLAHARQNYITIILLLIHMSIEWFEWSQKTLSVSDTIFNIGHILLDFIFLSHELSSHVKKYKYISLTIISLFLISIFSISRLFLRKVSGIDNIIEIIEPFVVGGVLGCIISHLFYHVKRFFKKEECCNH